MLLLSHIDLPKLKTMNIGYAAFSGPAGDVNSTLEMTSTPSWDTVLCRFDWIMYAIYNGEKLLVLSICNSDKYDCVGIITNRYS